MPSTAQPLDKELINAAVGRVGDLVRRAVVHAGREIEIICSVQYGRAAEVEIVCRADDGRWPRTTSPTGEWPSPPPDHSVATVPASVGDEGVTAGRSSQLSWGLLLGAPAEYSTRLRLKREEDNTWQQVEADTRDGLHVAVPGGLAPVDEVDRDTPRRRGDLGASFLAEASELLAGQLDEDMVAALAGQLVVPRVADWCGVWLISVKNDMKLSSVWHTDERLIEPLRQWLARSQPPTTVGASGFPTLGPDGSPVPGSAVALPLIAGGSWVGVMLLGNGIKSRQSDGLMRQVENMARLVAQSVATAREYARQTAISRALQRRQLPESLPQVPGVETAVSYEPVEEAQTVGGDFYDLFAKGDGRWCFLLGDVQGKDPEAMSLTGLARHLVRFLAREGYGVEAVIERLNATLSEDTTEALAADGESTHSRFLTMLYGELEPDTVSGGAQCEIISAGHPLPLRLTAAGCVEQVAKPQMLLGVEKNIQFHAYSFRLLPGEVLLCVTDGVTERRRGKVLFDDDDGLATTLRACVGASAVTVAQCIRQSVYDFSSGPLEDDIAVLVMRALPYSSTAHIPGMRPPAH
ncbi:PP2C family protein-serine/threonine phosphatase [Streptomyces sp. 1222.5]|uniref:PP2C family protein-serine/threonine phosphatase n=1 Tax=Streptomyces sp. 1222.5 TaxID=1881026 RepID=UPI003EC0D811